MDRIRIIISILSICFFSIAKAQNGDNQQENQPTKASSITQIIDDMVTFEVKTDLQKVSTDLNEKVLKNEVRKKSVIILFDKDTQTLSLSIDTNKVKLSEIKKLLNDKVYVLLMPEKKIVKQKVDEPKPPIEKYIPEIDKFLNLEDTTIFTSNFKTYDLQKIHPSRRNYYQVIEKIHDFDEKLKSIEDNLSISKINEAAKYFNITEDVAKKNLLDAAKADIDKAEKYLDGLLPFGQELDILSSLQKQYYKALKDKFNDLYAKINP